MKKRLVTGVLQARMRSTRLPGKILKEVCGKPLITLMLERLKFSETVPRWLLATSDSPENDVLENVAAAAGVKLFRGSESDVLDRLYQCAKAFQINYMVRLCADNPLIDPRVVDHTMQGFLKIADEVDYFSNHHPPTFPDGQEVEIIPFTSLEISWQEARQAHEREHGTPFLWDQPTRFRLGNYECPEGNLYHSYRWTLDYEEDYLMIKRVFEELYPKKKDFSMGDVMTLMRAKPDIEALNAMHKGVTWHHHSKNLLRTYDQYSD